MGGNPDVAARQLMRQQSRAYVRAVYAAHPELRDLDEKIIHDPYPIRPTRPLLPRGGLRRIVDFVCRHTGFTRDELIGPCRSQRYVRARCEVAVLAAKKGYTTTEIGNELKRDHSTICHYFKLMGHV